MNYIVAMICVTIICVLAIVVNRKLSNLQPPNASSEPCKVYFSERGCTNSMYVYCKINQQENEDE